MFDYQSIVGLHIEPTHKCQARCPDCQRTLGDRVNPRIVPLSSLDAQFYKDHLPIELIQRLKHVLFNGNHGDVLFCDDIIETLEYFQTANPDILLNLNTNGGYRDQEFWEELGSLNVSVNFALDGLEDTNHIYRINVDYHKVMENAATFMKHGGRATWVFIEFDWNKHQIEEAKKLAEDSGFERFILKKSGRKNTKSPPPGRRIVCNAIAPNTMFEKTVFIDATGSVFPCCWTAAEMYRFRPPGSQKFPMEELVASSDSNNLRDRTLEEIIHGDLFTKIAQTWYHDPLKTCANNCSRRFTKHRTEKVVHEYKS
jgi:MoaA/NifB/PqqE/SkfB family radical SAM enzyme